MITKLTTTFRCLLSIKQQMKQLNPWWRTKRKSAKLDTSCTFNLTCISWILHNKAIKLQTFAGVCRAKISIKFTETKITARLTAFFAFRLRIASDLKVEIIIDIQITNITIGNKYPIKSQVKETICSDCPFKLPRLTKYATSSLSPLNSWNSYLNNKGIWPVPTTTNVMKIESPNFLGLTKVWACCNFFMHTQCIITAITANLKTNRYIYWLIINTNY